MIPAHNIILSSVSVAGYAKVCTRALGACHPFYGHSIISIVLWIMTQGKRKVFSDYDGLVGSLTVQPAQ